MRCLRVIQILFVILISTKLVAATDTLSVDKNYKKGNIVEYMSYLCDSTNQLDINQILGNPDKFNFKSYNMLEINILLWFSLFTRWVKRKISLTEPQRNF